MQYNEFVSAKRKAHEAVGFDVSDMHPSLFDHQRAIIAWACRMGRAAVFADTGLGKTRIQLEWARHVCEHTGGHAIILAPLAVGAQTIAEGVAMGVDVGPFGSGTSIEVTNYERLHHVNIRDYVAVVLDESSVLKSFTGATRNALVDGFAGTAYRLACTATPAPNDHTELGNHAEFLGICSRVEMLSEFFVHDGGDTSSWRIKGHARGEFWRWVASWAVVIRKPSDLGFNDGAYALPPLNLHAATVRLDHSNAPAGQLFIPIAQTLHEQRGVRRDTVADRAAKVAELADGSDPVVVWCELNDESATITRAIPGAVEVTGSMDADEKIDKLSGFSEGRYRVLVTKASIAGFGMNWQHCHRCIFAGPTHSYEQFYQAIRRFWRFGQQHPVDVWMVQTEADQAIAANLRRKGESADEMAAEMVALVKEHQLSSVLGRRPGVYAHSVKPVIIPSWLVSEASNAV